MLPEQSGVVALKHSRAPPLESHDKELWTQLALTVATSAIPVLGTKNRNFTFTIHSFLPFSAMQSYCSLGWNGVR